MLSYLTELNKFMKYSPYDNTQSILIVRINLSLNYIIDRIDSFCCFIYQNDNEDALKYYIPPLQARRIFNSRVAKSLY